MKWEKELPYLWNEYQYPHDLVWRVALRLTFVVASLSVIPYLNDSLTQRAMFAAVNGSVHRDKVSSRSRLLSWLKGSCVAPSTARASCHAWSRAPAGKYA